MAEAALNIIALPFTCLNSSAVHLEVAFSLNSDSCIHAILRFIARHGAVKIIKSENSTNLVGAQGGNSKMKSLSYTCVG